MRITDRLFGWREITAEGEGAQALTGYLIKESVPAAVFSDGTATVVRVGRKDAEKIRDYLKEKKNEARFGPIRGLPALFRSIPSRAGIPIALLSVLLLFLFARSRVWEVRIRGDGSIDEDRIRAALYEAGLRPGILIKDVSCETVSSRCLSESELFSSVNVSLSGVVVTVDWIGRSDEPHAVTADGTGVNLVASCDGVIVSVEPTVGTALVVPGQTVRKGDLLISGVTPGGTVRASGTVLARVSSAFQATAAKSEEVRSTVKRRVKSLSIRMFGEELFSLGGGGERSLIREWTLPGGVVFPFSIRVGYACDTQKETVERSESDAARIALRRLDWMIRETLSGGELLKKEVSGRFDGDGYTATAKTEYLINIAEPLAFNSKNEYN